MARLDGKIAVITGGAKGIGKQIALTLAAEGADIVLGDVDIDEMETAAKEIRDSGRTAITVEANVARKADVDNLVDAAIRNFGKIDIMVNNAGISSRQNSLLKTTEEDWDVIHSVNLRGVFLCVQAAARIMVERKYGKIINIASVAGVLVSPGAPLTYSVAKAGVVHMTRVCARELGPHGINVNAIAPGFIITSLTRSGRTPEEWGRMVEGRKKLAALGRVGETQDIANLALFLASDESSFITGQIISADGGRF